MLRRRRNIILTALGLGAAMTMRTDDLTDLFTAQPTGPNQPMAYRQGIIVDWNPITLQNKILVGGTIMTDLPVLGVAEAASFKPGVTIGIATVGSSWAIIGRFVIPNTTDATDAITQIGQRTHTAIITTAETTSSITFTDLATAGPQVIVTAAAAGKAHVTVSAFQSTEGVADTVAMDFEVTHAGGTFRTPILNTALLTSTSSGGSAIGGSRTTLVEGLTPDVAYTFKAKYRTGGALGSFIQRMIIVENK